MLAENETGAHGCCVCGDAGFVRGLVADIADREHFGKAMRCPACIARASEPTGEVLERGRVPAKFREKRIEDWRPEDAPQRVNVLAWLEGWPPRRPLLMLLGDKGTGKTHMAAGIVREAWERHGVRGSFWPVIDLLDRYRATFGEEASESVAAIDEALSRTPLLVLDDIGTEKATDFASERVFRLVDERYREDRPLVVTTNVPLGALEERVRRRFADPESAMVIEFRSFRGRMGGGA